MFALTARLNTRCRIEGWTIVRLGCKSHLPQLDTVGELSSLEHHGLSTIEAGHVAPFSPVLPGEIQNHLTHLWKLRIRLQSEIIGAVDRL